MKDFRPRLPETENWKELIDFAREYGAENVLKAFLKSRNNTKEEQEFRQEGMDYILTSQAERVLNLDDLIEITDIDEDRYEIYRYITNKWDQHSVDKGLVELYQVKAWMKKKYLDDPDPEFYNKWLDTVGRMIDLPKIHSVPSDKPIVVALADIHAGRFTKKDKLVPDYNMGVIEERLDKAASIINEYDRPVHLKILGDFIESFTGKNNKEAWKQIEMHGMEVALATFDLIYNFIRKIDNFVDVGIVGGNHDRITKSAEADKEGQVAYLISSMLERFADGVEATYDDMLLTNEYDGIQYISTHGDKRISKKDANQMVLEYGNQNLYNVMLTAHRHDEKIIENTVKFKSLQIPAICSPNKYAVRNGWSSPSGFIVLSSNDAGSVDVHSHGV